MTVPRLLKRQAAKFATPRDGTRIFMAVIASCEAQLGPIDIDDTARLQRTIAEHMDVATIVLTRMDTLPSKSLHDVQIKANLAEAAAAWSSLFLKPRGET